MVDIDDHRLSIGSCWLVEFKFVIENVAFIDERNIIALSAFRCRLQVCDKGSI